MLSKLKNHYLFFIVIVLAILANFKIIDSQFLTRLEAALAGIVFLLYMYNLAQVMRLSVKEQSDASGRSTSSTILVLFSRAVKFVILPALIFTLVIFVVARLFHRI